ncbi:MAG: hypothetical protein WD733_19120 [Bryobacterales bacterium]
MTITIELSSPDEVAAFEAAAEGLSVENWLRKVAREQARAAASVAAELRSADDYRPISQVIAEIMSDVPAEEFAKLPRDGASQIDHYIYGHPKK